MIEKYRRKTPNYDIDYQQFRKKKREVVNIVKERGSSYGGPVGARVPSDIELRDYQNYDKEVFNGDIGIVESVDIQDRTLKVNFDNRVIEYDATNNSQTRQVVQAKRVYVAEITGGTE